MKKILIMFMMACTSSAQSMQQDKPHLAPLHQAVEVGDIVATQTLLNQQCDLEALNTLGETPLLHALAYRREKIALLILHAGANPYASIAGRNALHYAAKYGVNSVVSFLCTQGMNATLKDEQGLTPLEVAFTHKELDALTTLFKYDSNRSDGLLLKAVTINSLSRIGLLVREGIKLCNQPPQIQQRITQLFTGRLSSLISTMATLNIDNFKHELSQQLHTTNELNEALIMAYAQRLTEHVTELESYMQQAQIPMVEARYEALKSALARGETSLCILLLEKINLLDSDCENSFLLNLAAQRKHHDIVNLLLPKQNLDQALKTAVISHHTSAIEVLLDEAAPTDAAEAFINDPNRQRMSHIEEAFFATILKRFMVNNPDRSSYFSLLCRDLHMYILGPMVTISYPSLNVSLQLDLK